MRILFVIPYFAPAWSFGGPVKVVFDLSQKLIRQNHEVTVATTDVFEKRKRHKKKEDYIDGVHILYFKNLNNSLAHKMNFYAPIGFKSWLQKHIGEYDIVHCHDLFTWLNVTVARIARKANIPFIVQPHGSLSSTRVQARLNIVKSFFIKIYPEILQSASAIIALTVAEKNEDIVRISKSLASKTYVIPNGLSINQIRPHKINQDLRTSLGIKQNEKMILYVGRVHQIKGLDITVRALALLRTVPFKFFIIGRDEGCTDELQNLAQKLNIQDKIFFQGPIFGQKLVDYFTSSDVFVFNSRSEGLPMAALDSCAAGLPIILSPECHLPEIETFNAGIVIPKNTPEEMAIAISRFFSNPEKAIVMQSQCHRLIKEIFNLQTIAEQYINLYSKLAKPVQKVIS